MSRTNPDEIPASIFTSDFSVLEWLCNGRIALIVVLSEFYRFLNMRCSLFFFSFFCMGMTVKIEAATSLFIISHPASDTIVRRNTKKVAQQKLRSSFAFWTRFPPYNISKYVTRSHIFGVVGRTRVWISLRVWRLALIAGRRLGKTLPAGRWWSFSIVHVGPY